jgi:hypothetical protein
MFLIMRKIEIITLVVLAAVMNSCNIIPDAISGATKGYDADGNSFYHRTEETKLATGELWVEGEVMKSGKVNLRRLYKREVFYKQGTQSDSGTVNFVGAYRYRGYSMFDLLNPFILDKKNAEEFRPATDVYIIIENDKGDKVVFSWAEIYLTHNPHQIIIATEQASIEPYKREVDYAKGSVWKVVAANDLFANRELENPTKITVKSFDKKSYVIDRELEDPFSTKVDLFVSDDFVKSIDKDVEGLPIIKYNSIFYGLGMGYHNTPLFEGVALRPFVEESIINGKWMRNGLACIVGKDGFRNILSVSELFNRVDQVEPILAIPPADSNSGHFRLYHPSAFYADFSVKNLAEIYFFEE